MAIYGALVLSFLIRPAAALSGFIVVGPALVWLSWFGPTDGRKPTRHLMIAFVVIALIAHLTDKAAYARSPE